MPEFFATGVVQYSIVGTINKVYTSLAVKTCNHTYTFYETRLDYITLGLVGGEGVSLGGKVINTWHFENKSGS